VTETIVHSAMTRSAETKSKKISSFVEQILTYSLKTTVVLLHPLVPYMPNATIRKQVLNADGKLLQRLSAHIHVNAKAVGSLVFSVAKT